MSLSHRIRHCRNLQQLPQILRQQQVLGPPGSEVLRQQQILWFTRYLWETSEVTTAAKAVGHSAVMSLSHRIRHCRNLQQLPQVLRQPQVLGPPGSEVLRQPQVLGLPGSEVLRQQQILWSSRSLWETSEVTTAAKAVCHSSVMSLSHRIRHCRNLQQLPQILRQQQVLGPPGSEVLRQQQILWSIRFRGLEAATDSVVYPLPVGDVGGYDGSEGGGSVSIDAGGLMSLQACTYRTNA